MRIPFLERFKSTVMVRLATPDDLEVLAEMVMAHYAETGVSVTQGMGERLAPYLAEMASGGGGTRTLLAFAGEELAGMVQVGPAPVDISDGEAVLGVQWLYVQPPFRAKPDTVLALFRAVVEVAQAAECKRLRCGLTEGQSELAEIYMKRLGFKPEARMTIFVTDTPEA